MNWKENYNYWIENAPKNIVDKIEKYTEEEKLFNFTGELKFGTAGIRGIMGYGPAVLNEFIISKYALAYGKTLLSKYGSSAKKYGIVITHDNRRNNILFSKTAAEVISALDIPVFLFENNEMQPTPLLSFVISNGNYVGGINITASHNPAEYNGFKVYDHTGTQLLPNITSIIADYANEDVNIFDIKKSSKKVSYLSNSIIKQYINTVINLIPFDKNLDKSNLNVVFTAQHGTSGNIATKLMDKLNVNYHLVKEQMTEDPDFSNTLSPNPQNPDSFIKARELGDKVNADVLFSTDPDADRFGIEVKHKDKWVHIDGNQLPLIQISYKLKKLKEIDYLHKGDFIVKSVVTSKAGEIIANKYGVRTYDSLTGFKWIINEAFKHEIQGNECLFAWEESYGSTVRTFTKDKDSFQALVQVIEIASSEKSKGRTLVDSLNSIFEIIGYWISPQENIKFSGIDAMKQMEKIVEKARKFKVGDKISEYKITEVIDFSKGYKNLEPDNFVQIIINDLYTVTIRPSGTEPLLRIYYDIVNDEKEKAFEIYQKISNFFSLLKK